MIGFCHSRQRTPLVLTVHLANIPSFRIILCLVLSYVFCCYFSLLGCHSSCSSSPCHQQPECQHYWIFAYSLHLPASEESFLHQTQSINKSMILTFILQAKIWVNAFFPVLFEFADLYCGFCMWNVFSYIVIVIRLLISDF